MLLESDGKAKSEAEPPLQSDCLSLCLETEQLCMLAERLFPQLLEHQRTALQPALRTALQTQRTGQSAQAGTVGPSSKSGSLARKRCRVCAQEEPSDRGKFKPLELPPLTNTTVCALQ